MIDTLRSRLTRQLVAALSGADDTERARPLDLSPSLALSLSGSLAFSDLVDRPA